MISPALHIPTGYGIAMPSPLITPFNLRNLNASEKSTVVRPFLRWVGGKQKLLPSLLDHMPKHFKGKYFEPFLGGGSLFLANGFKRAQLSDINPHLINAYKMVRDNPDALHALLRCHVLNLQHEHADYYYQVRQEFNDATTTFDIYQAARFIFLNRSNFNGIFRVNKKGLYNVPFGHKLNPGIPALDHFLAASERLKQSGIELIHCGYERIIDSVKRGDFVYLDPPYPVLSPTANFTQYAVEPFSEREQHKLSEFAKDLRKRGAYVMISNAAVSLIRAYYLDWNLHTTDLRRNVSAKRPAIIVPELIITSYQV
jgi:DNA adenine methylase